MKVVRFTKQRQEILKVVQSTDCHPDASWVFGEVRKILPSISLGTVYRSLEALVDDGYLIRLSGEVNHYDARTEDHAHAICANCGDIIDVSLTLTPEQLATLPKGFKLQNLRLELHGCCMKCQNTDTALN